jgi:hypothetical protein
VPSETPTVKPSSEVRRPLSHPPLPPHPPPSHSRERTIAGVGAQAEVMELLAKLKAAAKVPDHAVRKVGGEGRGGGRGVGGYGVRGGRGDVGEG